MIVDKEEKIDEHAWTKLLGEKDANGAVIVKLTNDTGCSSKESRLSTDRPRTNRKSESLLASFQRHLRRSTSGSPGANAKRIFFKHGECNVVQGNVTNRRRSFAFPIRQDIYTTLVNAQWRWTLLVFAFSFLLSWTAFGVIWWAIETTHGDIDYMHLQTTDPEAAHNMTFNMCVTEIKSFASAFLFSIETQFTIGYGSRYMTEECPAAILTMCCQCIIGVFIQAFMVGIVFAKLSRPKKRSQTLLFSRNAVLCHRDGVPCLMFRVGDMRKSHIIEAHVRAQIIRKKVTKEGEIMPFYQQELTVGAGGGEARLMFIWPTTIVHKIDRKSPLYTLSAKDFLKERFEVVVMLEGVIESTGMTAQARTSYLSSEIIWGHRFVNVVSLRKETGKYEVDFALFKNTYAVDTPMCSAKELDEVKAKFTKKIQSGMERTLSISAGVLPRITSAGSLGPGSGDSLDSGRLHIRSNIPNGTLSTRDTDKNISSSSVMLPRIGASINNINEILKPASRRLSITRNKLNSIR